MLTAKHNLGCKRNANRSSPVQLSEAVFRLSTLIEKTDQTMLTPKQDPCHHVDTKTRNTERENGLIDAHPIIGFMAIILAFIMGQPPLELVTALGPAPLSDPLSLPLLLRVRDSLTCRSCQL